MEETTEAPDFVVPPVPHVPACEIRKATPWGGYYACPWTELPGRFSALMQTPDFRAYYHGVQTAVRSDLLVRKVTREFKVPFTNIRATQLMDKEGEIGTPNKLVQSIAKDLYANPFPEGFLPNTTNVMVTDIHFRGTEDTKLPIVVSGAIRMGKEEATFQRNIDQQRVTHSFKRDPGPRVIVAKSKGFLIHYEGEPPVDRGYPIRSSEVKPNAYDAREFIAYGWEGMYKNPNPTKEKPNWSVEDQCVFILRKEMIGNFPPGTQWPAKEIFEGTKKKQQKDILALKGYAAFSSSKDVVNQFAKVTKEQVNQVINSGIVDWVIFPESHAMTHILETIGDAKTAKRSLKFLPPGDGKNGVQEFTLLPLEIYERAVKFEIAHKPVQLLTDLSQVSVELERYSSAPFIGNPLKDETNYQVTCLLSFSYWVFPTEFPPVVLPVFSDEYVDTHYMDDSEISAVFTEKAKISEDSSTPKQQREEDLKDKKGDTKRMAMDQGD